jgi:hypothetical protein
MAANLLLQEEDDLDKQQGLTPISARDPVIRESNGLEKNASDQEMEEMTDEKTEHDKMAELRRYSLCTV